MYFGRTAALIEGVGTRYDPYFQAIPVASPVILRMRSRILRSMGEEATPSVAEMVTVAGISHWEGGAVDRGSRGPSNGNDIERGNGIFHREWRDGDEIGRSCTAVRPPPVAGCCSIGALRGCARRRPSPMPTVEQQIAAAVLPLPKRCRRGATVMGYRTAGKLETIRAGKNGMTCLALFVVEKNFHVACYQDGMEPFMARGRELRAQGVKDHKVDTVRFAEVTSGKIKMPKLATMYQIFGKANSWDRGDRQR